MGGYIRLDKDLEDDPRVDDLALALAEIMAADFGVRDASQNEPQMGRLRGLARDAVLGGLYRLWRYGDTYIGRHDRLKGASRGFARIEEVTALPVSLLKQFPSEWLRVHEDGTVELPGYASKNALINKDERREKGRERTRRWRDKKNKESAAGDASQNVTSKTSQRHQNVTTGTGPGPGTGTVPTGTGSGPETQPGQCQQQPSPDAPAACAQGHPPGRAEQRGDPEPAPPPTPAPRELRALLGLPERAAAVPAQPLAAEPPLTDDPQAAARKLASTGMAPGDIAHCLRRYDVTAAQVSAWLAAGAAP